MLNSLFAFAQKDPAFYQIGKTHFRTLCSSCHSVHQEIYGPMLASISKKRPESWLIPFIQNSQDIIKSGDPYARELFKKFNNKTMPTFINLSVKDIQSILYYLEIESTQTSEYLNDLDISYTNNSNIIKGKKDFLEHCSTCHFIHKESTYAPALGSITKRHTREWLIAFIQNSQNKIQTGDPYTQYLFKQFDKHIMTQMDFLSYEEINSILDYIEYTSTLNVAYIGKINTIENKKEAVTEIKPIDENYSPRSLFNLLLILTILVFMSIQLYQIVLLNKSIQNRNNTPS